MDNTFTTVEEARQRASVFLRENNREPRVADLLLEHYLNLSFAQLLARARDPFPEEVRAEFVTSVQEHATTGRPVQHIIGYAPFYGRDFKVSGDVLIPRPETEELVVGVVDWMKKQKLEHPSVVDLGTGSGVIAITTALEYPQSQVTATDLSADALAMARHNAEIHEVDVHFAQGDFLEPVAGRPFDVLISNPPYIDWDEKEAMDDTVTDFDPELALFAQNHGLAAYQTIIKQVKQEEHPPGLIAFEIGHEQGEQVKRLLDSELPLYIVEIRKDLNGKDRMVFATLRD
ncbi:peptide chain release factor N(5)-glutamine methyltransferase [Halobacillus locisalis]|uniref:peptide chain release factor N(5)-glutamine methyltransferase n=1 Tax=Halobacillus locisalis TaxID=220753 RepID=UPI0031B648A0